MNETEPSSSDDVRAEDPIQGVAGLGESSDLRRVEVLEDHGPRLAKASRAPGSKGGSLEADGRDWRQQPCLRGGRSLAGLGSRGK